MRKWKTQAAPDDPNVWSAVSCMWPTRYGTYETSDFYDAGTDKTATGETAGIGAGNAAWCFNTLSGQCCYIFGAAKIWQYASGSLTDRTAALGATWGKSATQYGNITLAVHGSGLIASSGGNFALVAGSPIAQIVVTQSNAVVAFNTSVSTDGWAASDVGDYTNWTTNEAASGRILDGNGPI